MRLLLGYAAALALLLPLVTLGCGGGTANRPPVASANSPSSTPSASAITVALAPSSADVAVGSTQQFTATVTGTSDTAVTWSVNGLPGGDASVGTVNSAGLYTAPAVVPAGTAVQVSATSQANSAKSASASVSVAHLHIGHVFLLVEENHSYSSVIGNPAMPYLNSLARQYALATNYYANAHPSIGNYFMLTTGQLVTTDDTFTGAVSVDNFVRELLTAGKTWKSYAESLPGAGYTGGDAYPYLERHNPFSYLSDVRNSSAQRQNLVPFTQFTADLGAGQVPDFSYIVPNGEHDAHDCPDGTQNCSDTMKLSTADSWLKSNIGPLLSSALFQKDGLLVIVFDEAATSDSAHGGGHVAMLMVGPAVRSGYQSAAFYQHQNTLRLLVNSTGAGAPPGNSASASAMSDFLR